MDAFGVSAEEVGRRMSIIEAMVAKPFPSADPGPGLFGEGIMVGNKYHLADVDLLSRLGITSIFNCAPSGIRNLPRSEYDDMGIKYTSTNVKRDDDQYPILHCRAGVRSEHLKAALECYREAREAGGKVMFACVAGQNRSATLATAVLLLSGTALEEVLERCSLCRPFVLENAGFQRQLVELEAVASPKAQPTTTTPRRRRNSGNESELDVEAETEKRKKTKNDVVEQHQQGTTYDAYEVVKMPWRSLARWPTAGDTKRIQKLTMCNHGGRLLDFEAKALVQVH